MIWQLLTIATLMVSNLLAQSSQPASETAVYIALGDSVAAGVGTSLPRERSYPTLFGNHLATYLESDVRVENLALPGESAASFLTGEQIEEFEMLIQDLDGSDATVHAVSLSLGGNEVLDVRDATDDERSAALAEFSSDYPVALEAVRGAIDPSTPLLLTTIYDPTGEDSEIEFSDSWWIAQFNAVIRDAARSNEAIIVELADGDSFDAVSLTRYPVDYHPTNDGNARIAALHWQALGLDIRPPVIKVTSSETATRFTPTIRFSVTGDTIRQSITVASSDGSVVVYEAVDVGENEYAVLVDASQSRPTKLALSVFARDAAGNSTELDLLLEFEVSP
ncbi:hypothetical protein BH23CHL2_BH23CHL2_00270 [soil metagenome]